MQKSASDWEGDPSYGSGKVINVSSQDHGRAFAALLELRSVPECGRSSWRRKGTVLF